MTGHVWTIEDLKAREEALLAELRSGDATRHRLVKKRLHALAWRAERSGARDIAASASALLRTGGVAPRPEKFAYLAEVGIRDQILGLKCGDTARHALQAFMKRAGLTTLDHVSTEQVERYGGSAAKKALIAQVLDLWGAQTPGFTSPFPQPRGRSGVSQKNSPGHLEAGIRRARCTSDGTTSIAVVQGNRRRAVCSDNSLASGSREGGRQ